MNLPAPPTSRPAEHLLKAHLAHATHHELLGEGQATGLAAAIGQVAPTPPSGRKRSSATKRKGTK